MTSEARPYWCTDTLVHVDEFVDSELGPSECDRIDAHLAQCSSCREAFARHIELKAKIAQACACRGVPDDVRVQVRARISALRISVEEMTFESLTIRADFSRRESPQPE